MATIPKSSPSSATSPGSTSTKARRRRPVIAATASIQDAPPKRRSRVSGTFWDITGTGLPDNAQNAAIRALVGRRKNYEIPVYRDDGTDAGELLGTYSGEAIMTARNLSTDRGGDGGQEITLEGQDTLTYTPA